jgi:hypothetical protein
MRKSVEIKLEDRGHSHTFRVEEMPATRLESWIIRAVLLLAGPLAGRQNSHQSPGSAGEAGADDSSAGMGAGVNPAGFDLKEAGTFLAKNGLGALGRVDYDKAKPLLDELLGCCYRVVGNAEERCTPSNIDDHIKDVGNLLRLKAEALKVNLGFLGLGNLFTSPERSDSEPK